MAPELLEQVMWHIHNFFDAERVRGHFTVSNGALQMDVTPGRYIRVVGSVFNDGVHRAPCSYMTDEEFDGEVWLLSIPKAFLDVVQDIEDYQALTADAEAAAAKSPYSSESFGGYSYSLRDGLIAKGDGGLSGWQAAFASRLNPWRKMSL